MPAETQVHYEEQYQDWNFFETPHLKEYKETVTEFVQPPTLQKPRAGWMKLGETIRALVAQKKFKKYHATIPGYRKRYNPLP